LPSVESLKTRVRSSAKKAQQGAPGDAKKRRA